MLRQKAEENHRYRTKTQPGRKDNLGCVFAGLSHSNLSFIGILAKLYSKTLALFTYKLCHEASFYEYEKFYLLSLFGLSGASKYLYSYNQYLWKDTLSHYYFPKYIKMMKKLYKNISLEIEIF